MKDVANVVGLRGNDGRDIATGNLGAGVGVITAAAYDDAMLVSDE